MGRMLDELALRDVDDDPEETDEREKDESDLLTEWKS